MNRKANIEFLSKSSVIITNAYRQKAFDLDDMFSKRGLGYIDLIELKFVSLDDLNEDDANKTNRKFRFVADLKNTSLSILAKPRYDGNWMLIGVAQMGFFQYWHAGQRKDEGPDEITNKSEGTFRIKII